MAARPSHFEHSRFNADRLEVPASDREATQRAPSCSAGQGDRSLGPAAPGEPLSGASTCPSSAREWITIFATWYARRRPGLSAEEVLSLAISEFKVSHTVPPEQAAERYGG